MFGLDLIHDRGLGDVFFFFFFFLGGGGGQEYLWYQAITQTKAYFISLS